jgi:hypothetical protein
MSSLSLCRAMIQASTIAVACVTSTLGRYGGGEDACGMYLVVVHCLLRHGVHAVRVKRE